MSDDEPEKVPDEPSPEEPREADFVVDEQVDREDVNAEVRGMVGTAAGNIRNSGQTAVGAGAMAAEQILNNFNVNRETKGWSGLVRSEEIERLLHGYARNPSDPQLAITLKERAVVYLSASPGCGRYTAAQVALAERHAADRVFMIHIAPGQRIADAIADQEHFAADRGHLVDAAKAHAIEYADLLAIEEQVRDRNATAVVIGPLAEQGHDLGGYLVEHRRTAAVDVFRSRLAARLTRRGRCVGSCAECRRECLPPHVDRWASHVMIRQHLTEATPLEVAASAAAVVADAERDADLEALLGGWLNGLLMVQAREILRAGDQEGRAHQREWSGTADYRRAFRLAFAVLAGASLNAVFQAADQLVGHLTGNIATEPMPAVEQELDCLLSDGMWVPGGQLVAPGEPKRAALANPGLVPALLDVAWNERGLGAGLLSWLDALVQNGGEVVRRRAAIAVGLLCFNDFEAVMAGLVRRWSASPRKAVREAAGMSLLCCAHHPELRRLLRRELDRWVTGPRANAYTRDAAAWAYAYGLGSWMDYDGLRDLRRIGAENWQRRSLLVAIAVDGTYRPDRAAVMLDELRDWALDKRVRVHAARAFVQLANRDAGAGRPELLDRYVRGDVELTPLAELWSVALSLSTAFAAWRALTRWLDAAGDDDASPFLRLIEELARDTALHARLIHQHAHVWTQQRPATPLLAAVATTLRKV